MDDTRSHYVDCRLPCMTGCAICSTYNECGLCSPGYYKSQKLCLPCSKDCSDCSKSDHCTECKFGFFLEQNVCHDCPQNCLTCSGPYHCNVCKNGFYGQLCQEQCKTNCIVCDKESGSCADDSPTDKTNECDKCKVVRTTEVPVPGVSVDCPKNCEHCDENGKCLSCKIGYWSDGCDKLCGLDCLNKTCDADTGSCSLGQSDALNNTILEITECPEGYYGDDCNQTCPNNCRRSLCGMTSGNCLDGCNGGYHGVKCDIKCENKCFNCSNYNDTCACTPGYFGDACNKTCPGSCNNFGCHRLNGSCLHESLGCKDGDDCHGSK